MQYEEFEKALNPKQLEAVESASQYLRVVAGAGSGKTRVLTYRISFLISQMHVEPWKILAITFTNKVANEMKERVINLVPEAQKHLTIKTFHSFAAMFLRREISALNYPLNFTILDDEDQTKLIKDIASEKGFKKNDPIIKQALNYISTCKLDSKYPDDIKIEYERFANEKICYEIYTEYEELKARQFALDFDDLLLKTNLILESFPLIKEKWRKTYSHILVDEFQDTNKVEYKLIKHLMNESTCLYVVGDPDQNIYTWRGAQQDIIVNLHKELISLETILLEENYRSTQSILDSANKLISYNKLRVPKNLFTNNGKGSAIVTRCFDSGMVEADYIAREIKALKEHKNYKFSDIALLYRSNYITLDFEKAFMAHNIPYVIYGGVKFYQRMEIKDVISYFRLINNKNDDISFERIINVPKRGIGEKSIEILKATARQGGMCIYDYVRSEDGEKYNSPKVINALKTLETRIDLVRENIKKDDEMFSKILEDFVTDIGYYDYLRDMDDGDERIDNVKSLFEDIRHYLKSNPESSFDEYLQNVALVSAQDDIKDGDHIKLMTVHTAKGLEFPVVFVARFNEDVFPNARAVSDSGFKGLEEERRLAYVALTRAKEKLYLTYCEGYSYVNKNNLSESRFIKESGNHIETLKSTYISKPASPYGGSNRPYRFNDIPFGNNTTFNDEPVRQDFSQEVNDVTSWSVGDVVIHKKLGKGVVVKVEEDSIIQVDFDDHGRKTILGNHPSVSKGNK